MKRIEENLQRLKNDREQIVLRVTEMKRLKEKIQKQSQTAETSEERDLFVEAIDSARSTTQLGERYLSEIDVEIERIKAALSSLHESDIDTLREAFADFVLTDTSFSVKNVGMMLYDFDELIKSMVEFSNSEFES